MKNLVSVLCRGLGVADADANMVETQQESDVTVELSLPVADISRIDGREHRTARAVRQVLSAAAAAQNKRFHLVAKAKD